MPQPHLKKISPATSVFLTLLGLRESSLLSKHMAGCKTGPVGTGGRNSYMKMQKLPGVGREKCLGISIMVNSRVK